MLANCKKHYCYDCMSDKALPLGVCYNSKSNKYYGWIQFAGSVNQIRLYEWDTKKEIFAEYKMLNQADILTIASQYKNKVLQHIYEALLKVEVKPY